MLVGIAAGTTIVLAPTSAYAAGGNDDNLAVALQKFDAGKKAFEGGQFEEALNAFKSSLELLPSPNTRLYIGRCYRALGKIASAYTELKLAASEAQDRLVASGEKRYSATRDNANEEAAALEAKVPRLTVAVPANPPTGFVVKVDGKELPTAAWGIASETNPGSVVVEATGPRLVPFKQTVPLAEGAKARVDIPMERLPTATFAVKLKNLPSGLAMTLDGTPIEAAGVDTPRDLDIGAHSLVVSAPGYVTFHWDKSLANNDKEVVEVTLAADPNASGGGGGTPKWLFFAAAGTAVAAAGVGTTIGLIATNTQNQQTALPKIVRSTSTQSSIQSQATIADVLFIGSAVVGAGAVVLLFTTHWKSEGSTEAPVSFAPWLAPGAGGLGATGTF
jgi:hypothetical protein